MPPWPPDIQDLIGRMLAVDPAQRISIRDIKRHAAFARGLSPAYVLPAPVPFSKFTSPLDAGALPDHVIGVLRQIGFADAQALAALLADRENNAAKVFVRILLNACDLEELPWELANAAVAGPPADAAALVVAQQQTPAESGDGDAGGACSSYGEYSLGEAVWEGPPAMAAEVITAVQLRVPARPLWCVMEAVQRVLGEAAYQWFHPDSATIVARAPDGSGYYGLVATLKGTGVEVTANVHRGDAEPFLALIREALVGE
jgi:hypothetical protein